MAKRLNIFTKNHISVNFIKKMIKIKIIY